MKNIIPIILLSMFATLSSADIYQCINASGNTIFKDKKCNKDEKPVNVISDFKIRDTQTNTPATDKHKKVVANTTIEDDKPGKLIYSDNKKLYPPYKIKVNEVRIVTETDDKLVVDVIYTYKHKIPAKDVNISVSVNHNYWSIGTLKASSGKNVSRASIGLSTNNMKKDNVTSSSTNVIVIKFSHYKKNKNSQVIWSKTVKYEKNWSLRNAKKEPGVQVFP